MLCQHVRPFPAIKSGWEGTTQVLETKAEPQKMLCLPMYKNVSLELDVVVHTYSPSCVGGGDKRMRSEVSSGQLP
jgi:hypothetical protein